MAAHGGAKLQLQFNEIELGSNFQRNNEFDIKTELGLGWLRAVAQVYNYSYNKIKLGSNVQWNLKS